MYLHYFTIIVIIKIFSIFSTAPTQDKNENIELITNNTKTVINQAETKRLVRGLNENIANTTIASQSNEDPKQNISSFLLNHETFSVFNIAFTNNVDAIGILKKSTSPIGETHGDTTKYEYKDETVLKHKYSETLTTSSNRKNDVLITASNEDKDGKENKSTQPSPFLSKDTVFSLFNDKETLIDILKPVTDHMAGDKNLTKEEKVDDDITHLDKKESEMEYVPYLNTTSTTVNSLKTIEISTKSTTTSSEILLSELTNLSYNDDDEVTIGQRIDFYRSKVNSETDDTNTADILNSESKTCGSLLGKRISFANATTLMQYPWTALLLYNTKSRYHCGGSLITKKYVLTAAHCVAQEFYELSGVRLGEHDITTEKDCAEDVAGGEICSSKVEAKVVKIIIHHAYSHRSFKNDIALLRLDQEYISRSYYPICVPTADVDYKVTQATVAGWGATEKALRSTVLLQANVPIFDISKCREIYRYSVFNDATEICASGKNEVDVCKGDSGGAIFDYHTVNGRDKYFQLGIISLGVRRCGDSRFLPAVFTKLTGFRKWIENNLEF